MLWPPLCAERYGHKPMIFAKKAKSDNIEGGLYQSDIYSYTYKKKVTLLVSTGVALLGRQGSHH